ncbi:MAG TPA: hypothetical protein VF487_08145 [Chitinophagaceae bacterium]
MKGSLLKTFFSFFLLLVLWQSATAQIIAPADHKKLKVKEDSLREWAQYMITDSLTEDRMYSDSIFTRTLVRTLQIKNSFYYPFDSVLGISRLYAPDSSFRIFTWNLQFDDYYSRQKGAIQMRTNDGSLKLIPLRDSSEFAEVSDNFVADSRHWIGAIYYNVIKTQYKGKNYYTLFGFDQNTANSSKKWIEVMYFNEKNQPVFGGPFFTFDLDSAKQKPKYRLGLEFKKDARILMNYIPDMDMILVDHLISETDQPELASTMVPDGDSEGYKWENGKWVHIDKVFTFKLQDGQAPVGDPLMDSRGNKNEIKLQEKSDKNRAKKDQKAPLNNDN